jgi:hypothetical protein
LFFYVKNGSINILFKVFPEEDPWIPCPPFYLGVLQTPPCATNFKIITNYTTFMIRLVNSGVGDGNSTLL